MPATITGEDTGQTKDVNGVDEAIWSFTTIRGGTTTTEEFTISEALHELEVEQALLRVRMAQRTHSRLTNDQAQLDNLAVTIPRARKRQMALAVMVNYIQGGE